MGKPFAICACLGVTGRTNGVTRMCWVRRNKPATILSGTISSVSGCELNCSGSEVHELLIAEFSLDRGQWYPLTAAPRRKKGFVFYRAHE
jgi:hypothetical protein